MTNDDISTILRNIGYLLQIRDDDSFRTRIYDRAADAIDELSIDLRELANQKKIQSVPGIGKAIEERIIEMLDTGQCRLYDELIGEMGDGILELLAIRGVGAKTVGRFYHELGVRSITALRAAIDEGRLKEMKRMGAKTIASIDEGLRFVEAQRLMRPLWRVMPIAQAIFNALKDCTGVGRVDFTGEMRRREEILQSLEFTVECSDRQTVVEAVSGVDGLNTSEWQSGEADDASMLELSVDDSFPLRIYLLSGEEYEAGLLMTTGAEVHLQKLNEIATQHRLEPVKPPSPDWANTTETDIYSKLGMPFIVPELRRDTESIDAALSGHLPNLIELGDLRGDLHMHTHWSDGRQSILEMVQAAKAFEHDYIAITDHSESSRVANGLTPERLLEQLSQVRAIDAEVEGIKVFAGSEVDIRNDGSLDFSDDILAQLDIVVASVHANFSMSEAEMTKRIIGAIENPLVKIIGHPTGRMLGRRPGYAINLDEIIAAALENHVALEINASPSRLDLEPDAVRKARDGGVLLSVNTDAHAISQLEQGPYGINVARRGGLEKKDVINTYSLEQLGAFLEMS